MSLPITNLFDNTNSAKWSTMSYTKPVTERVTGTDDFIILPWGFSVPLCEKTLMLVFLKSSVSPAQTDLSTLGIILKYPSCVKSSLCVDDRAEWRGNKICFEIDSYHIVMVWQQSGTRTTDGEHTHTQKKVDSIFSSSFPVHLCSSGPTHLPCN